jgi:gliding motility-associated-like protein
MKPYFLKFKISSFRLAILLLTGLFPFLSFSQATDFYNGGAVITVVPSTIVYVGGHITNDASGTIHNEGDIYLTGDWTNNVSGGLDANLGKVVLYGSALQNIQGSATTTFNDLDCQLGSTKKLNVNTSVGGSTGVFSLNSSPFNLNSYTCTITNPSSTAITRTTGYIISETGPSSGYGRLQWNIDNSTSSYTIPFGTANADYIPFIYNVTAPGSTGGNISVATYPTSVVATPNNRPLPAGVTDLNYKGAENAASCVDRFWVTDLNYSNNPTADLTFTYLDPEWNAFGGSTNSIIQDSLQAWRWDGSQWQNPTVGSYIGPNQVKAASIDYSGPWTLSMRTVPTIPEGCGDYTVPNAFSPNNDGHNDSFILHGWANNCVSDFTIVIYDRWGEKVFESEDPTYSWDGSFKGKTLDAAVFVYYIKAKTSSGTKINKKGNISLIR